MPSIISVCLCERTTLATLLIHLDARRYVNNMCLTVKVALVESGTAGYLGQTSVILPGHSECFECTAKERPKVFPVCTIRTTPSTMVHCIVWAKEFLLPRLLGPDTGEEEIYPPDEDDTIIASLKAETEAFKALREMDHHSDAYAQAVFDKIYSKDIRGLREFKELWETRRPPAPLEASLSQLTIPFDRHSADEHKVWSLEEWLLLFRDSLIALRRRPDDVYFEKDDEEIMDFVAAAANIRAHIFHIALASRFASKSMAGNIIPAIATTNAIVAGQIVLQALNILKYLNSAALCAAEAVEPLPALPVLCNAFVTYGMRRGTLFACERLPPPNPQCAVCQVDRAIARVHVDRVTLGALIDAVLRHYYRERLGINVASGEEENLMVLEGSRILFDEEIGTNRERTLAELGCDEAKFIKFEHAHQSVPLLVAISDVGDDEEGDAISFDFILLPDVARAQANVSTAIEDDEDDLVSMEGPPPKMAKLTSTAENDDAAIEVIEEVDDDSDNDLVILS